jgi:nitrogen fixation protein NifU and related proteins
MDEIRDLYQQVIIDHSHHPRNYCATHDAVSIQKPNLVKDGYNPLCGDKLTLYVREKNGVIEDICFEGCGCAIFMASASLMTEAVKGKSVEEFKKLYQHFHILVTSGDREQMPKEDNKLSVLSGVADFPIRVKCATLPWHTLKSMLTEEGEAAPKKVVSTE